MRDLLTALAGAVVLILVAALAVPPFVDWSAQRALIDRTLGQSLGAEVLSEGAIDLRLLPSPHLRLERLRLGPADGPRLDGQGVEAEIALAPLLKGEMRLTRTEIERARVLLPVAGEALLLPHADALRRDVVVEDLRIRTLSLATVEGEAAPEERLGASDLRLKAPNLAGPWLVEGTAQGAPFHLATSAAGADGALSLKLNAGGDAVPRLELDARLAFKDAEDAGGEGRRAVVPEADGSAKLTVGPPVQAAGAYLPFTLATKLETRGPLVRAKSVELELDPGGKAVRLTGVGRFDLRAARAGLELRTRRLDLDGLLLSPGGRALLAQGAVPGLSALPALLDLDLSAESVALGLDDWANVSLRGTFDRAGGLVVRRFSALAPGAASVAATGEIDLAAPARFTGHLDVAARNSEGLGRYLARLGAEDTVAALLDGRALEAGVDLSAAGAVLSLRNLRLALGEARITGDARYARAETGKRGRLDAQIAARTIDIAELPPVGRLMAGLNRHDLGLTLTARAVRYGAAGAGDGTIAVSLQSDGASLVVDSLEVTSLAGASARLAGRIAPDGSGRIEGQLEAPKAAPLVALLERGFLSEARLLPRAFREGPLDLDVTLERESGEADALRATARGEAGGGHLDLTMLTRAGRIDGLDATATTQRAGLWFGRDDIAALGKPARLRLTGTRAGAGQGQAGTPPLALGIEGSFPGLTVTTPQPLRLDAAYGPPSAGEIRLEGTDVAPFLTLAGPAPGPVPAALTVVVSRPSAALHAEVSGQAAGTELTAALDRAPDGALSGTVSVGRLSLPALVDALALPSEPRAGGRFLPLPEQPRASLDLRIGRLDFGRGLLAEAATLRLLREGDALSLRDLAGDFAGGRIAGSATITRPGPGASVSGEGTLTDAEIPRLLDGGSLGGRISATLRFSATGASHAALADDLSGNGEIRFGPLSLPQADPAALDRALTRALAEEDPLREGRLQSLVAEELNAGPLATKAPVSTAVTLSGGTLRSAPFGLDLGGARWTGTLALDLRRQSLDARGTLTAAAAPKGWSGAAPAIQLGFSGPLTDPERRLDTAPLTTGLAALVLQRELEKIELFDADQAERQRRRARIEMDRARAAAAEEAARQARIRAQQAVEEAARQARLQREAEEAARRARQEAEPASPSPDAPLDITPPGARP